MFSFYLYIINLGSIGQEITKHCIESRRFLLYFYCLETLVGHCFSIVFLHIIILVERLFRNCINLIVQMASTFWTHIILTICIELRHLTVDIMSSLINVILKGFISFVKLDYLSMVHFLSLENKVRIAGCIQNSANENRTKVRRIWNKKESESIRHKNRVATPP